jgi:tripartite-type tricarboxylate transporter receptor subunit TctC
LSAVLPCLLFSLLAAAVPAFAQSYPSAPVRIYTSEVGGGVDIVARILGEELAARLGQPVLIENRGGSVSIAAQAVAKSLPDGHAILFYGSPLWLLPLMQNTPYDPLRDFAPVTLAATSPNILVVHPVLPVTSVKDLAALAKAQPGRLNYAAGVAGASAHLAAELFNSMAGVKIVRISYKGSAPALTAVASGEVQLMFAVASGVPAHVKAGRLKALAVTSLKPSPLAPGLPSIAEQGLPGYEAILALGVYAPAATPPSIVERLNQELVRAIGLAAIRERLMRVGFEPAGSSSGGLLATVKADIAKWSKVIKEAGLRAD